MILRKLAVGPYASNCYIVGSESNREGLIIDPGAEAEEILGNVRDLGLTVKSIVITHNHIDHIGVVMEVKEATGAEVAIHTDDAPSPSGRLLNDGDIVDIGDLCFSVLHTPGHSPGGICLYGEGVVFSGDTLFNYSIGRTDFPNGNHSQLMDSIYTKLMVLPDNTVVCPGHGPDSTIGTERQGNPFLRRG